MKGIIILIFLITTQLAFAAAVPLTEFQARRKAIMEKIPDGILLLHSRSNLKRDDESGFKQDPTFYYFTGLENAESCILAIDGVAKQSVLFIPQKFSGVAGVMKRPFLPPDHDSLLIERIVGWDDFIPYIERKKAASTPPILYFDDNGYGGFISHESNPVGMKPIDNPALLWKQAVAALWSGETKSASEPIQQIRSIKSTAEIHSLRSAAKVSVQALLTALSTLKPGIPQRNVEAAVVSQCLTAGGQGPSFWPWIMTGPNSAFPAPFESFADYRHLNRTMESGEVVRVDIGCEFDHYQGDVGRTAPVSGRFDDGQKETWELLVRAYKAGLATIRDGVKSSDVLDVFKAEIAKSESSVKTPLAKRAIEILSTPEGSKYCQIHGIGLEPAEGGPDTLHTNMVIDFEPIFSVDGQGFYLEDMILVTPTGNEVLTSGLPYSADEIENSFKAR
jgi:Xaa-Pro aminopeptidase